LGLGQMLKADGGHFHDAEQLTGLKSPVSGYDLHFSINQQRHVKAERLDAPGDLLNLLFAVYPGILRVGLEAACRPVHDGQILLRRESRCRAALRAEGRTFQILTHLLSPQCGFES
jgi:hypothetical protein